MIRKLVLVSALILAAGITGGPSAQAGQFVATGPRGGTVAGNTWRGPGYWGRGPCCSGRNAAAGAVAGLAVGAAIGAAAASRPVAYVAPPPPPSVVYVRPPVVYAPYGYYYGP
ncbi:MULTISPECIES: hypothetical protein [unclassified Bradyrhizobium]|uniref:hypothetical protein n=1 Tax=unclassified Bradyrhizobium TaxID=2631580 RepID=UPI0028E6E99B|nr:MULTISPECIES: hypothetical protein [unclassified Bradyrhizobium]